MPRQAVVQPSAVQSDFRTATPSPSGVDHDTPQSAAYEFGNLLVVHVHVEHGGIQLYLAVREREVSACLIIITVFRFEASLCRRSGKLLLWNLVDNHLFHGFRHVVVHRPVQRLRRLVLDGAHHPAFQIALYQVAEHLYVVPSAAITLAPAYVHVVLRRKMVLQGHFG